MGCGLGWIVQKKGFGQLWATFEAHFLKFSWGKNKYNFFEKSHRIKVNKSQKKFGKYFLQGKTQFYFRAKTLSVSLISPLFAPTLVQILLSFASPCLISYFLSEYINWTSKSEFFYVNTTILLTNSHLLNIWLLFSKLWNLNICQIHKSINSISENTFMMRGAIFCLKCLVVCLEFLRTVCTVHHRPTGLHALSLELPNFVQKLMLHFFLLEWEH